MPVIMKKTTNALLIIFGIALLYSCNPYRQTSLGNEELYNQRRLAGSYKKYVILVHEPSTDNTYRLENVYFAQDTIIGDLKPVQAKDTQGREKVSRFEVQKRVYLELNDDVDMSEIDPGSRIMLPKKRVKKVQMYAKQKKGALGIVGTVVLVVLGVLLALLLILVIAIANSDNGGSTSGGSNSGGGGGNSGTSSCYVATMVYGSSESDEVLVLRAFRDKILAKHKLGRAFILWYYNNSPSFVEKWESNSLMTRFIRAILNPIVRLIASLLRK
jgi:hypothetical protein